jgi:hypothetical protein
MYQNSYTEDSGIYPVKYFTETRNFVNMLPGVETKVNYFVQRGSLYIRNWRDALEAGVQKIFKMGEI